MSRIERKTAVQQMDLKQVRALSGFNEYKRTQIFINKAQLLRITKKHTKRVKGLFEWLEDNNVKINSTLSMLRTRSTYNVESLESVIDFIARTKITKFECELEPNGFVNLGKIVECCVRYRFDRAVAVNGIVKLSQGNTDLTYNNVNYEIKVACTYDGSSTLTEEECRASDMLIVFSRQGVLCFDKEQMQQFKGLRIKENMLEEVEYNDLPEELEDILFNF